MTVRVPPQPQSFRKADGLHRIGLAADKPAPDGVLVGTLYFSTDTPALERSDGLSWVAYSAPLVTGSPLFSYDFSSATVEPPTSNQLRLNAAAPYQNVTKVWVRTISNEGRDLFWGLMLVAVGSVLNIQDKNDHTLYAQFVVTDVPVDKTGYVEFAVTWRAGAGVLPNNQAVLLQNAGTASVAAHHATHEPGGADALTLTAPSRLFGRGDSGAGAVQEITLSNSFIVTGTTLTIRTGIFNYTYNNSLAAPPAAGQCRLDAAYPWTAATKLWLRFISADGQDLYWGIMILPTGATIILQDKDDHTRYGRFKTTGVPVDSGLYAELPITWVSNGTAIVTAQQVFVRVTGV